MYEDYALCNSSTGTDQYRHDFSLHPFAVHLINNKSVSSLLGQLYMQHCLQMLLGACRC